MKEDWQIPRPWGWPVLGRGGVLKSGLKKSRVKRGSDSDQEGPFRPGGV